MIEWQNNFEAVMTDRSALSDTYIKISPVPRVSEGRLVLEDNSTSNYEIIHYTSKDAGGVYTTDGGARNEDGNSNGIHAKGARVRMNLTAQDMQDIKDIATGSVVKDGSVTNAKLSTTAGDIGGAWKSWTPTLSGRFTDAKWYKNCYYTQIGKTVICSMKLKANATTPMAGGTSNAIFSLPVAAATNYLYAPNGLVYLFDYGVADNYGIVEVAGVNALFLALTGGSYMSHTALTSTAPFVWDATDEIWSYFSYEAA